MPRCGRGRLSRYGDLIARGRARWRRLAGESADDIAPMRDGGTARADAGVGGHVAALQARRASSRDAVLAPRRIPGGRQAHIIDADGHRIRSWAPTSGLRYGLYGRVQELLAPHDAQALGTDVNADHADSWREVAGKDEGRLLRAGQPAVPG